MKFVTFSSFRRDNSVVQLIDILKLCPENNMVWNVLDYYGVGDAPNGMKTIDEFEALVASKKDGYLMSWKELIEFASSLRLTIECLIVGGKDKAAVSGDKTKKESFSNSEIIIKASEDKLWSFWARKEKLVKKIVASERKRKPSKMKLALALLKYGKTKIFGG